MKTFFTFILILIVSISSHAQKSGVLTAGMMTTANSFSIEKAYPNPVKDIVTIELQSEDSGDLQVSLINILGSEVKKWDNFYVNPGNQSLKIDLSQFKNGVYILRITKKGQTKTQLLKKN
jgi:hypothetical protein